jgi:hypothetical protein
VRRTARCGLLRSGSGSGEERGTEERRRDSVGHVNGV